MNSKNIMLTSILGISIIFVFTASSMPTSYGVFVGSPNFQLESGVASEDIQCSENHVLVIRTNGNSACVSFHTGYTLLERGWITFEPIHEQMKTNFEEQQEPRSSLERAPADNTIEWLKSNSVPLDVITLQSDTQDANIIPKYLPSYYELKLHLKPSNMPASQHSTFWYLPEDVDVDSLEIENDLFQVGGIKLIVRSVSLTQDEIDSTVSQMILSGTPDHPVYHEKIGNFDVVFKVFDHEDQHQVKVFNEDYSIYLGNLFLPKSEIEKVILSLSDEE